MELLVRRIAKKPTYTIGHLYIDGVLFCDTLEDTDRGLICQMPLSDIKNIKVYGKTAIPTGTYNVELTYSPHFKKILPLIKDVPGYSGIRIHQGNTDADTEGCILVGQNKAVDKVLNSTATLKQLMKKLTNVKNITITIE